MIRKSNDKNPIIQKNKLGKQIVQILTAMVTMTFWKMNNHNNHDEQQSNQRTTKGLHEDENVTD